MATTPRFTPLAQPERRTSPRENIKMDRCGFAVMKGLLKQAYFISSHGTAAQATDHNSLSQLSIPLFPKHYGHIDALGDDAQLTSYSRCAIETPAVSFVHHDASIDKYWIFLFIVAQHGRIPLFRHFLF
jgi:hypothetical protein